MKFDPIGMYRGKNISEMTRDELLNFAAWAGARIEQLEKNAEKDHELDLHEEVLTGLRNPLTL